jgi:hypothetical protein
LSLVTLSTIFMMAAGSAASQSRARRYLRIADWMARSVAVDGFDFYSANNNHGSSSKCY